MNKDDLKHETTHVERTTSPVTSFDSGVKTGHQDGIQQMLDQGQHIGYAAATEEGESLRFPSRQRYLAALTFEFSTRLPSAERLGVSLSPTSKRSFQLCEYSGLDPVLFERALSSPPSDQLS